MEYACLTRVCILFYLKLTSGLLQPLLKTSCLSSSVYEVTEQTYIIIIINKPT